MVDAFNCGVLESASVVIGKMFYSWFLIYISITNVFFLQSFENEETITKKIKYKINE